jgi:hypothetical protein
MRSSLSLDSRYSVGFTMLANQVTPIAGDWVGRRSRREPPNLGAMSGRARASIEEPLDQAVRGGRKEDRAPRLQRKSSHGCAVEVTELAAEVGAGDDAAPRRGA